MTNKQTHINKHLVELDLVTLYGHLRDLHELKKSIVKRDGYSGCPLCLGARQRRGDSIRSSCDFCPWRVMVGNTCARYVTEKFGIFSTDAHLYLRQKGSAYRKWRLPQLNRWIRLYKQAIRVRTEEEQTCVR